MTSSVRMLMVEDQGDLRDLISEALRDLGLKIDTADDGHSALKLMREQPYDVVFSDINMPNGMSGIELSEHVAELQPQARMVLSSGFARTQLPELPEHALFLPKPYRLRQLLELIRTAH